MAQFYLLSIVANIVAGLTLSSDYLGRKATVFDGLKKLHESKNLKILLGVATALIGVLKLIFKSPGETVPVAGDMLPAIYGIGLGLLLLGESFRREIREADETGEQKKRLSIYSFGTPIGLLGIIVSLLHFVIPSVVIL